MFEEEQKTGMPIQEYWVILWHRRWWLLLTAFACWAIVWGISWVIPAVYRSETLILVEQQKVPEQYVLSNVSVDLQERLQSMTQQILSRTRLQRIIDQFNLYAKDRDRLSSDELVDRMRKDINIELVQSPDKRGDLTAFRIYYSARNARTSQQIASQLTSLFIQENLQAQQEQSESTTAFLANELEQARSHLMSQDAKIREFKARFLGQLPSQMESNVQILTGLQTREQGVIQALNHSQQQKLYLESLLNQYRSVDTSDLGGESAIDKEIGRLKTELANAQAHYTPGHPDVVRLKSQLERAQKLKQQAGAEVQRRAANGNTSPSAGSLQVTSPMMQIESQLKANAREIEDTQAEIRRIEGQIAQYQGRLNLSPVREQQLADLMRDYEQSKANYDSLLKKQMQSQLATNLEKRQQGQQFRILDPPSLPTKPFSPNRLKYSAAGIIAGTMIAFGLIVLFELVDVRIRSEHDLEGLAGSGVLVRVPHLGVPGERRKRVVRLALEWSSVMAMGLVFAGANLFTFYRG